MARLLPLLLALFAALAPVEVASDTLRPLLPALYRVVDVAANDVLNIREAPDASSRIVGSLAPDRRDVEVLDTSLQGNWAMIGEGEHSGWVALRFLARQDEPIDNYGLPATLRCVGAEPFYSFRFTNDGIAWSDPEGESLFALAGMQSFLPDYDIRRDGLSFSFLRDGATVRAMIVPSICDDGMSDRLYGMRYIDDRLPHYGCCTLR